MLGRDAVACDQIGDGIVLTDVDHEDEPKERQLKTDISAESESLSGNCEHGGQEGEVAASPCCQAGIDSEWDPKSHDVIKGDLVGATGLEPATS